MSVFEGIDPDRQKRIVAEVRKELRREMEPEIQARVKRQIEEDIRRDTRREVLREIEERAPTRTDRRRFVDYVEEVELDAHAQASLASDIVRDCERQLERAERQAVPAAWLLTLATPTLVYGAARTLGATTSAFIAVLATLTLALASLGMTNWRRSRSLRRRADEHRRIASDYLIVAERAKAYRLVHAERIAEAAELDACLADLRKFKEKRDEAFHASADEVEVARERVRHRIDLPPRIAVTDDEEDPVEAEAEAEAEAARASAGRGL